MTTPRPLVLALMIDQALLKVGLHKLNTAEPLNNGHIGMDHFIHYREIGALESVLYICRDISLY